MSSTDLRRSNKIVRYKPVDPQSVPPEDSMPEYMNILGMVFSMCGLMMRVINLGSCHELSSESDSNLSVLGNIVLLGKLDNIDSILKLKDFSVEELCKFVAYGHQHVPDLESTNRTYQFSSPPPPASPKTGFQYLQLLLIIILYIVTLTAIVLSIELTVAMIKRIAKAKAATKQMGKEGLCKPKEQMFVVPKQDKKNNVRADGFKALPNPNVNVVKKA
ncbi:Protein Asterix [Aphelenchoides besseyi]|nr:Protein Asterix [Aphelenchoides besseyi]